MFVEVEVVESEDYQALTEREELDLQQLMSQCDHAVSNAETFMETLAKDLSILDGVCSNFRSLTLPDISNQCIKFYICAVSFFRYSYVLY